jgi:long-chain-fatty-acid--CoA ligase ACSBG
VEDEKALEKMWSLGNELPKLKRIIQYTGTPNKDRFPDVLSWDELMALGKDQPDSILTSRLTNMAVNQCCTLVYTSGTTGNPKGVMLSHDNIYWTATVAADWIQMREGREIIISYLPLSHVAGQMLDIWATMVGKATVYFADKMALKGTLLDTLKEVRPTIFFGVPRVWEKIMEGMVNKGKAVTGLKKKIAIACKKAGLDHHLNGKDTMMYSVGQKVIYKKIREALGLDRCVSFFSGAAPISLDTLKYFLSLDIVIHELYGMSEVTGPQSIGYYNSCKVGSVGKILPGCKNRLANPDEKGEGEVCMWGRHVMMGYLNREDKTTEDVDEEGWMHSGDLGTLDSDGFLFITGNDHDNVDNDLEQMYKMIVSGLSLRSHKGTHHHGGR